MNGYYQPSEQMGSETMTQIPRGDNEHQLFNFRGDNINAAQPRQRNDLQANDMMQQNEKDSHRRRGLQNQQMHRASLSVQGVMDPRRFSMMEFGGGNSEMNSSSYGANPQHFAMNEPGQNARGLLSRRSPLNGLRRHASHDDLGFNPAYPQFDTMASVLPFGASIDDEALSNLNIDSLHNSFGPNDFTAMDFMQNSSNPNSGLDLVSPRPFTANSYGNNNFSPSNSNQASHFNQPRDHQQFMQQQRAASSHQQHDHQQQQQRQVQQHNLQQQQEKRQQQQQEMENQQQPQYIQPQRNIDHTDLRMLDLNQRNLSSQPQKPDLRIAPDSGRTPRSVVDFDANMSPQKNNFGTTEVQSPALSMSSLSMGMPLATMPSHVNLESNAQVQTGPAGMDVSNTSSNNADIQNPENTASQVIPQYRNAYSQSGFDMLGVLMRVAARPNPQINIGAVDMSCAFVVCDVTQHDIPIVYCSDVFERLTAYTKHEILGRNCRFLQSPDGRITAGAKRKYVDDSSIYSIKKLISRRQEAQVSVINYRKGGQPFMNLLTMIPITWDSDEIKYYVGLQVDLVEQPTSITNKNPDGTYSINYQRGLLPRYVVPPPPINSGSELSQTVHRDEVSAVLQSIGKGESDLSRRIWDKVLLENTDDVVHVLSLKGLFLYLSPACRKILEYEPSELVGTALSSVCHPSDIVPVMRELKDTTAGTPVNIVYRIRRKDSGYTWFESYGSLHLEQGKGRKCIIMAGRERPVYALNRADIVTDGGFGESELWTKLSTSGMFLFVSSNVRSLLDRQPEDLLGTSAQALMRQDARREFGRKLELVRTGKQTTFKHDLQHRRGQTLQAQTTLYPGDASLGQKPTFLVAQTRLLKPTRHPSSRTPASVSAPNSSVAGTSTAGTAKTDVRSASVAAPILASKPAELSKQSTESSMTPNSPSRSEAQSDGLTTFAGGTGLAVGTQHEALASADNVFDELKTTRSTSWQFELRQMEKRNRFLAEELQSLLSSRKKRKRRQGGGLQKECVNCHTRTTPEWRRGPSGQRELCNSCGLRWAKETGRVAPRTYSNKSGSPQRSNSQESVPVVSSNTNNPANSPHPNPSTTNMNPSMSHASHGHSHHRNSGQRKSPSQPDTSSRRSPSIGQNHQSNQNPSNPPVPSLQQQSSQDSLNSSLSGVVSAGSLRSPSVQSQFPHSNTSAMNNANTNNNNNNNSNGKPGSRDRADAPSANEDTFTSSTLAKIEEGIEDTGVNHMLDFFGDGGDAVGNIGQDMAWFNDPAAVDSVDTLFGDQEVGGIDGRGGIGTGGGSMYG